MMKLSEAIRKGHTMIGESKDFMTNRSLKRNSGCALCAAWYGMGNGEDAYWDKRTAHNTPHDVFSAALGITAELSGKISAMHSGGMSRMEIADWVEREYESKLPQKHRETDHDYTQRVLQEIVSTVSDKWEPAQRESVIREV